jgi:hypothetical protein
MSGPRGPPARSAVYRMLKDDYYIGVGTLKGARIRTDCTRR